MTVHARRTIRNFAVTFAILYAGCFAALWALQDRFIYPGVYGGVPNWVGMASPVSVKLVPVPVDKHTDLAVLYRRPDPGRPTIIVFHGNAGYPED